MTEPILTDTVTMQQRRGLKSALPATAPAGQLLVTTDTSELYVGTGTGVAAIRTPHKVDVNIFNDNQNAYADGLAGQLDPKGREGWYFANAVLGQKINWYYYDPSIFSTTVAQFLSAYAIVTFDATGLPFFAVYTAPTGSGNAAVWYKSRRVYSTTATTPIVGTRYLVHIGTDPGVYPELPRIVLTETTGSSQGAFAATETINLIALNTNSSASPTNSVKFVVHQLGFRTTAATLEANLKLKAQQTLTYTQATPASVWTINHNTGKYPVVTTVDASGNVIVGDVQYVSSHQIKLTFSLPTAGAAYLN